MRRYMLLTPRGAILRGLTREEARSLSLRFPKGCRIVPDRRAS